MDLKEERDKDLLEAYSRVIKRLGERASLMTRESLIDLAINSPAKRFYVTVEEAAKHINSIERRGKSRGKRELLQKQYNAIYRHYQLLAVECKGMCKSDIISMAIEKPAECFYIEPSSACVLFWKLSNGKKKHLHK